MNELIVAGFETQSFHLDVHHYLFHLFVYRSGAIGDVDLFPL
jgi:hypothetical protein